MKYCLFVLLCALISCSQSDNAKNNTCIITLESLLSKDSERFVINDRYKNGSTSMLVDKGLDSCFGAYYFYPSGVIKSYKFLSLPATYFYSEEYDLNGNVISMQGSPLVLHSYRKVDSLDVNFTFFFSSLHWQFKKISITTNIGINMEPVLLDNAVFTNVKSVTFKLPVAKNLIDLRIVTTGLMINKCMNKELALNDTATFSNIKL